MSNMGHVLAVSVLSKQKLFVMLVCYIILKSLGVSSLKPKEILKLNLPIHRPAYKWTKT